MQGADRVNEELEVGFNQGFERRWSRAERFGYGVMLLFALAGLGGVFGRGAFSHRTAGGGAAAMTVDFEPVTRSQSPTQVTFHLDNPTDRPTLRLFLDNQVVEPMGLGKILPQPERADAVADGLALIVAVPPGTRNAELRIVLEPKALGPQHLTARLDHHAPLGWTQFVVP